MNRAGAAVLAAILVVLAGCSGGVANGTASPAGDGDALGSGDDETVASGDGSPSGSVNFYVSDRPGDMDDFEHLTVTVTTVRLHLVERANDSVAGDGNATVTPNATTPNVTTLSPAENGTATVADGMDDDGDRDADGRDDDGEDGRWVERDVEATTVDLTKLRGANATLVETFDVPAGKYDRVVLEVSDVNGTLADGESTRVKLPSGKLQLNTGFTVEHGSEVDFVYDIMVHKAGNSGKYILRPVLAESGTDQPIERVDERGRPVDGDDGDERERDDEDERERDDDSLTPTLSGAVAPGENVTLTVTDGNATRPVANATVTVDGEQVGTTDADGAITVAVPADEEELEVEVEAGDREGELERELDGDESDGDDSDDES